jgi:translation elongation factor EF-Ts
MAGRIESYIHSDSVVPNKGGCLVEVRCQTDFASKTDEFIAFAKEVAKLMYAYGAQNWEELVEHRPDLETSRRELKQQLKEEVRIGTVVTLRLGEDTT